MNTGTKIFLAVFALFVGVLVLYYGVLTPGEAANSNPEMAVVDPAHSSLHKASEDEPAIAAKPVFSYPAPASPISEFVQREEPAPESASAAAEVEMGSASLPPALDPTRMLPLTNVGTAVLQGDDDDEVQPLRGDSPTVPAVDMPKTQTPITPQDDKLKAPPIRTVVERPVGTLKSNVGASITPSGSSSGKILVPPQTTEYTVKSGDTMVTIAKTWFGDETKWSLIAKANPWVDPARMQIGQKLQLPAKDAKPAPVKEQLAVDKSVYIVRSGDSLAKIAREFYDNVAMWEKIYEINRAVIGDDPADLQVGIKLKLPSAPVAASSSKSR
jgi:nucleoid-associated protein YgaU